MIWILSKTRWGWTEPSSDQDRAFFILVFQWGWLPVNWCSSEIVFLFCCSPLGNQVWLIYCWFLTILVGGGCEFSPTGAEAGRKISGHNQFPVIFWCFSITIDRGVLIFGFLSNQKNIFHKNWAIWKKNLILKYKWKYKGKLINFLDWFYLCSHFLAFYWFVLIFYRKNRIVPRI